MIFSILCYLIAGLSLAFWGHQASLRYQRLDRTNSLDVQSNEFIIILILTFFLFFGLRSETTGVDTPSYIKSYETFGKSGTFVVENIEPAFKWIIILYSSLKIPTWIFLGTFGLIEIIFVLLSIRNQHFLYPYVCAYIILGPIFLLWANGMRQCVASCIFLYSIVFIEKRNWLKYFIYILVGTLMHKSAIILIPLYWLLRYKLFPKNNYLRIIILLTSVLIGQSKSWISNIDVISNGLTLLGYDEYSDNLEILLSEDRQMAFGPSRITQLVVAVWVIWKMPMIIKKLKMPQKYVIYFSLYFVGSCLYNIFANTSHIFLRPIEYFTVTGIVLVPLLLYYEVNKKHFFKSLIYGFLIYWYSTYVSIKAFIDGLHNIDPSVYSFCFI